MKHLILCLVLATVTHVASQTLTREERTLAEEVRIRRRNYRDGTVQGWIDSNPREFTPDSVGIDLSNFLVQHVSQNQQLACANLDSLISRANTVNSDGVVTAITQAFAALASFSTIPGLTQIASVVNSYAANITDAARRESRNQRDFKEALARFRNDISERNLRSIFAANRIVEYLRSHPQYLLRAYDAVTDVIDRIPSNRFTFNALYSEWVNRALPRHDGVVGFMVMDTQLPERLTGRRIRRMVPSLAGINGCEMARGVFAENVNAISFNTPGWTLPVLGCRSEYGYWWCGTCSSNLRESHMCLDDSGRVIFGRSCDSRSILESGPARDWLLAECRRGFRIRDRYETCRGNETSRWGPAIGQTQFNCNTC